MAIVHKFEDGSVVECDGRHHVYLALVNTKENGKQFIRSENLHTVCDCNPRTVYSYGDIA